MHPGAPFWNGFTAFAGNLAGLFALDKLDVLSIETLWAAAIGSLLIGGAVYGRAKVAEFRESGEREAA